MEDSNSKLAESSKKEENGSQKEESSSKLVYEAPKLTELYLGPTIVSGGSKGENNDMGTDGQNDGWENVGGGTTDI